MLPAALAIVALATTLAVAAGATKPPAPQPRYRIGKLVLTFVDHSRVIRLPGRPPQPREIVTVVRYPLHAPGPAGLIVFGHGFAVTPATYWRLLSTWARAGFVVAAPVFPLGNARAPGGPDEADIVNQPRDMSLVITRMLRESEEHQGPLAGLIDPRAIAVAGQSDGAETALAVADDSLYRDSRIDAAVVLSGAEMPIGTYFERKGPPLLAVQGTADTRNEPRYTYAYFGAAPRPKFLLRLIGAGHLPPYTYEEPQLSIVERVTIAFFDRYLYEQHDEERALLDHGDVPGIASLTADP